MIPRLAGIGRAALGMGLATMLSACIMVPLPNYTATPSIVPQLPRDLHDSDVEALVLTTNLASTSLDHPIFMRARDFESLTTIVKLESGMSVVGIFPGHGGVVSKMGSLNPTLCVIVPDGRTFMFTDGHPEKGFATYRQETLSARRRDAIVSALRDHGASAFDRVDGPCGISARVDWPRDIASTVIEFLMRTPGRGEEPPSTPLARLVESRLRPPDEMRVGTPRVLLLVSATWRGAAWRGTPRSFLGTIIQSPVLLNAPDVDAVMKDIIASREEDILQSFDSFRSSSYSPVNLKVERACAVSSDGRVVWWSAEHKTWMQLFENPPDREWKASMLGFVAGTSSSDRDLTFLKCVPNEIRWSAEERLVATAFLERLPSQERPPSPGALAEVLIARSRTLLETPGSRGTDVMLLCSPWCTGDGGLYLTPAFLRVDNVPTLAERISFLSREDFVLLLSRLVSADPGAPKSVHPLTVYVVGSDSVVIRLAFRSDELKVGRSEPKRIPVSPKWRSDAIYNATRSEIFGADARRLPPETRKRVVTFLETMNRRDSEREQRR
jgi:hypothetical protein